jgi:REP element-mobilizing transposase RayT
VHHVIVRGVEKRTIFLDDSDCEDFLRRLDRLVGELGFECYAWSLIPNHAHLVLRRGRKPLALLMARLETGYARRFNRRYARVGHLFQDRYRSRLVEDESALARTRDSRTSTRRIRCSAPIGSTRAIV